MSKVCKIKIYYKSVNMPFFCEIDDELNFTIEIIIDPDFLNANVADLFKKAITLSTNINNQYAGFIAREGRIRGQERTQLIEALDNLFILLVMLRLKFMDVLSPPVMREEDLLYKVPLSRKLNKLVATGKLNEKELFGIKNFNEGYEKLILNKIKKLLINYKNIINSQSSSSDDSEEMFLTFDDIFYNSIIIRYNLENLLLDR